MLADTHVHLSYPLFDQIFTYIEMKDGEFIATQNGNREELISKMKEQGIEFIIEPAIDVDSNKRLISLSKKYDDFVFGAVGNHPTRTINSSFRDFKRVREFAEAEREIIVGIGETGLDYHYERKKQHRLKQKIWFQYQINLADKLELPLILHIREANKDAIKILRRNKNKLHGGVCHCFSSGSDVSKIYTEELGLCLGIGATILKNETISAPLKDAVKKTKLESLLIETDGPYVKAPRPVRNPDSPDYISKKKWERARNTSLILPAVIEKIAEIKEMSPKEVERITHENALRVFKKISIKKETGD
ncbi:MAG: TatD family hydrolase [Eubacterium sp.]|nr:TatD family hydrolase [Eubacterium sp.]